MHSVLFLYVQSTLTCEEKQLCSAEVPICPEEQQRYGHMVCKKQPRPGYVDCYTTAERELSDFVV